ncbi:MAG: hypothetical protein LBR84_07310, partial [Tannerella sp.]|nr:hypothetical protein [Tannerella sp.]
AGVKAYLPPGKYLDTLFLYYGGGYSLPVLTVCFTVYDYATPTINRQVELVVADGFQTNPSPGVHWIKSATDFIITITPPTDMPDLVPVVTDSRNIQDAVSLTYDPTTGTWLARVYRVQSNIQVRVNASATGNAAVASDNAPRIWASGGMLHVVCSSAQPHASVPPTVKVYTLTGTLVVTSHVQEGETVIPLVRGIYIVKVGDTVVKVTAL